MAKLPDEKPVVFSDRKINVILILLTLAVIGWGLMWAKIDQHQRMYNCESY